LSMKRKRTSVWLLRFRGSRGGGRSVTSTLQVEAPIARPDGGRGFSLAASAGGLRRPPSRPVPTGGSALARPDDVDRKRFRACRSRARSPPVQDLQLFQYPASETKAGRGIWFCPRGFGSIKLQHRIFQIRTMASELGHDPAAETANTPFRVLMNGNRLEIRVAADLEGSEEASDHVG